MALFFIWEIKIIGMIECLFFVMKSEGREKRVF